MRSISFLLLGLLAASGPAQARVPLEKQFFDYFAGQCQQGLSEEVKALGRDPSTPVAQEGLRNYCACTAQAVVSFLTAEEMIGFAVNPEAGAAAGKMRPYFERCQNKVRGQVTQ